MEKMEAVWMQLEKSMSPGVNLSVLPLSAYLVMAGVMGMYVRFLYQRCSRSPSDTESFSRVFPLLAVVTAGVIAVVKSSLALSLGLVGALSIVRFRAAIKDPEELVYLFLSVAIGLALGAEQPLLAVAIVLIATVFVLGMFVTGRKQRRHRLLLTVTGDTEKHFAAEQSGGVLAAIESIAGRYTLQRLDVENGRSQVRIVLNDSDSRATAALIARLRERLPDCEMSYVNLNSTI